MIKKLAFPLALLITCASQAQQIDDFDYHAANRTAIRNGIQAILMCNGLFTSGRTLEQVFKQEPSQPAVRGKVLGIVYRTIATYLTHKALMDPTRGFAGSRRRPVMNLSN